VTQREIAFSMIGLGVGLMLAVVVVVELLVSASHHMFIFGIHWVHLAITLALPLSLIVIGLVLIYRDRSRA
jgi:hypothetical protein